ncbi:MAG TPA: hypothetical protein VML75_08895 [Kofleriaceae bacterium]|nr:hypothetical protein [Kofleriaceae bacterium]
MSLRRRQLISFGFLRDRAAAGQPAVAVDRPPAPTGFSLERFYRDRASNGTRDQALPPITIRVLPEDFEDADE